MKNGEKFNSELPQIRILIAPLDWGLGHATRCIPIIKELFSQHCAVIIAASDAPLFLLKKEFPKAVFLRNRGYQVKYSSSGRLLPVRLLLQLPGIILSVWRERAWLRKVIKEYGLDAVISDNRPGMYNKSIPCVYITHQLHIKTGRAFSEKIVKKVHSQFIKKYSTCWVPDIEQNSLAGALSHPAQIPSNVLYIGPLSRFEKINGVPLIYNLLISLSGPEPQRTIFEKIILGQLRTFKKKVLLVRGLPGENKALQTGVQSLEIVNHLPAEKLNRAFLQAEMIISRSGYSTIMDLVKIGRNAILVPTPGQTEQEYLAGYLAEKKYFYAVQQNNFSLERALAQASLFPFKKPVFPENDYKKAVGQFVESLKPQDTW
ncbi:MAG: glycosyltransferase [Ginsengibacter sp.]